MADRLLNSTSHQDNERLRQPNSERALAILVDINSRVEAIQTATTQINKDLAKLRDSLSPQPTSEPDSRPDCPIDLEPIDPEEAEALPCGHVFHSACIATWLRQSNTCPIDRSTILNGNEQLQQQQEPPYELSADPLQITIPGAFPSSDTAEDSQSSPLPSTDQHDWDTTRPPSRVSSTPSTTSETRPSQQSSIRRLAFLRQVIMASESLESRAQTRIAQRVEIDLNRAFIESLRRLREASFARMREIEAGTRGEH